MSSCNLAPALSVTSWASSAASRHLPCVSNTRAFNPRATWMSICDLFSLFTFSGAKSRTASSKSELIWVYTSSTVERGKFSVEFVVRRMTPSCVLFPSAL
ncbi:hypothetical protein Barb7_02994 [Bacteroidales bacterium Barb7]|nr:hypothetical protein Barb7_02994 [Bacteroidales bacterium Barb7]